MFTTPSPLRCEQCGWLNQVGQSTCFSCHAALSSAVPISRAKVLDSVEAPSFLSRILASLLDLSTMVATTAVVVIGYFKLGQLDVLQVHMPWLTWLAVGLVLAGLFLPAVMDSWSRGSFGKRQMGLRVITNTGQRPGILQSCIRHALKFALHLGFPGVFYLLQHLIFGHRGLHGWITRTNTIGVPSIQSVSETSGKTSQSFSQTP